LRKVRRSCLEMQIPHSFVQQYSISFLAEIRNVIILARHSINFLRRPAAPMSARLTESRDGEALTK
jgi:hypothetical protein